MINENAVKAPKFTEKTILLKESNKYTFIVDRKATKGAIKDIIEKNFDVKVDKVAIAYSRPKQKRSRVSKRREAYLTKPIKKAIVTLKEGNNIDIFELQNNQA